MFPTLGPELFSLPSLLHAPPLPPGQPSDRQPKHRAVFQDLVVLERVLSVEPGTHHRSAFLTGTNGRLAIAAALIPSSDFETSRTPASAFRRLLPPTDSAFPLGHERPLPLLDPLSVLGSLRVVIRRIIGPHLNLLWSSIHPQPTPPISPYLPI